MTLFAHQAGSGPPVLLIHGLGADHTDWRFQIPALAAHYRVLAVDLPGFGASAALPGGSRIEDYAQALHAWLDEQGVGTLHAVIGHSMGGAVALEFALARPTRTSRLVLMNTLISFVPRRVKQHLEFWYRRLMVRLLGLPRLAELSAWRMFPGADQGALRAAIMERGRRNRPQVYRQALAALSRWDARDRLASLTSPVLWLASERDYFDAQWVREGAAALAQVDLQWFEARHGLPMEAPEAVNAAVLTFLAA